jgi:hypothetical protein
MEAINSWKPDHLKANPPTVVGENTIRILIGTIGWPTWIVKEWGFSVPITLLSGRRHADCTNRKASAGRGER